MKGAVVYILILIAACTAGTVKGQNEKHLLFKADSLDKQTVSKSLLNVRDSLNSYRALVTQKIEQVKTDPQARKRLTTALIELGRSKEKLEEAIAEVAASKNDAWNTTLYDKAYNTLRDTRRDLKKIRADVKDLVLTSS
jgi:Holliday junction resolvasome RuvABC DNA-binding subunit